MAATTSNRASSTCAGVSPERAIRHSAYSLLLTLEAISLKTFTDAVHSYRWVSAALPTVAQAVAALVMPLFAHWRAQGRKSGRSNVDSLSSSEWEEPLLHTSSVGVLTGRALLRRTRDMLKRHWRALFFVSLLNALSAILGLCVAASLPAQVLLLGSALPTAVFALSHVLWDHEHQITADVPALPSTSCSQRAARVLRRGMPSLLVCVAFFFSVASSIFYVSDMPSIPSIVVMPLASSAWSSPRLADAEHLTAASIAILACMLGCVLRALSGVCKARFIRRAAEESIDDLFHAHERQREREAAEAAAAAAALKAAKAAGRPAPPRGGAGGVKVKAAKKPPKQNFNAHALGSLSTAMPFDLHCFETLVSVATAGCTLLLSMPMASILQGAMSGTGPASFDVSTLLHGGAVCAVAGGVVGVDGVSISSDARKSAPLWNLCAFSWPALFVYMGSTVLLVSTAHHIVARYAAGFADVYASAGVNPDTSSPTPTGSANAAPGAAAKLPPSAAHGSTRGNSGGGSSPTGASQYSRMVSAPSPLMEGRSLFRERAAIVALSDVERRRQRSYAARCMSAPQLSLVVAYKLVAIFSALSPAAQQASLSHRHDLNMFDAIAVLLLLSSVFWHAATMHDTHIRDLDKLPPAHILHEQALERGTVAVYVGGPEELHDSTRAADDDNDEELEVAVPAVSNGPGGGGGGGGDDVDGAPPRAGGLPFL